MNFFFDTETTGLPYGKPLDNPDYPWPVEVAGILATPGGETVSSFRMVVRPDGWVIPAAVVKIHNIDTSYAQKFGTDLGRVLTVTAVFVEQARRIIGWNVQFDRSMIESAALRLKLPNPLKDVPVKDAMQETSRFLNLGRMSMSKAYDCLFAGGGTAHRKQIGIGGGSFTLWLKKQSYPAGFRTMCFNCNWSAHLGGGKCYHERIRELGTDYEI